MQQLIECIIGDLQEPFAYIPHGIVLGATGLVIWLVAEATYSRGRVRRKDWPVRWERRLAFFLSVVYVTVMIQFAFFSRPPGSRTGIAMQLFSTWGKTAQAKAYVIENAIMFIPFGMLFPLWVPFLRHGWQCIIAGAVCSIGLEWIQWMTARGHCQLDDVLMNVLGTVLGWLFICRRAAELRSL